MLTHRSALALIGTAAVLALTACSASTGAAGPVVGDPLPTTATTAPTAAPAEPALDDPEAAPSSVTDCGPDQVTASVEDREPAASSRSLSLMLQNTSTTTDCALTNPPNLELLDGTGSPLPTTPVPVGRQEGRPGPIDVIPAGFSVNVLVEWRVVPGSQDADPAVDCVSAAGLRVWLTDASRPVDARSTLTACAGGTLYINDFDIDAG